MQCLLYCIAEHFDLKEIREKSKRARLQNNVVYIKNADDKEIFLFSYGTIVFWNFNDKQAQEFTRTVMPFAKKPLDEIIKDECDYEYGKKFQIDEPNDKIVLDSNEQLIKLSCSYALAQAIKLESFECQVEKTIEKTKRLNEDFYQSGKISLSPKQLQCYIGSLFTQRSNINLHSDILESPDFFWSKPGYTRYYEQSRRFMDIDRRVVILNNRLNVIYELYELLSNELKHRHSSRLELTIILLILVEVMILMIKDIFHWV